MRADAGFHAEQAWRHVGKACFYLATRPLLPQHDGTAPIQTYDVERVLADVDADGGDRIPESFCHGVLLAFGAPHKHRLLVEREHGRSIPLTDIDIGPSLAPPSFVQRDWASWLLRTCGDP
jgi:hypothetical protein